MSDLYLTIDLGNTRAKAGLFENGILVSKRENLSDRNLLNMAADLKPVRIALSTVRKSNRRLISRLESITCVLRLRHDTPLPFAIAYATPNTLGADRIAAAAGAWKLFPGKNCMIIDAGTCITYDLLDAVRGFMGGAIAPGIDMKLRALHKFTSGLPRIASRHETALIGQSTRNCMLSGVVNGTLAEMKGFISAYREQLDNPAVLLCGGDAKFFESKLKQPIFAVPDLVLMGLHEILRYNSRP